MSAGSRASPYTMPKILQRAAQALCFSPPAPRAEAPEPRADAFADPRKHVVVIGAGPVGLAAALEMQKLGHQVTVVEKRDCSYTRPVHFNLRPEFLDVLRDLGVYRALFKQAGAIESLAFHDDAQGSVTRRDGSGLTRDVNVSSQCRDMLARPSVAQVSVADLERALYAQARKPAWQPGRTAIRFLRHSTVEVLQTEHPTLRVTTQAPEHAMPVETLLHADLVVAADGANSRTREQLALRSESLHQRAHYIAGTIDRDVRGTLTRRITTTKQRELTRQICVGHQSAERAWVLVEVPERKLPKVQTLQGARAYYLKHANKVLDKVDSLFLVSEGDVTGGDKPFEVVQRRTFEAARDRCLLIGDAVGTGHFLTSGGINTALVYHLRALRKVGTRLSRGDLFLEQSLRAYDVLVRQATNDWIEAGKSEFVSTVPVNFGAAFGRPEPARDTHDTIVAAFLEGVDEAAFRDAVRSCGDRNGSDAGLNGAAHVIARVSSQRPVHVVLSSLRIMAEEGMVLDAGNAQGVTVAHLLMRGRSRAEADQLLLGLKALGARIDRGDVTGRTPRLPPSGPIHSVQG